MTDINPESLPTSQSTMILDQDGEDESLRWDPSYEEELKDVATTGKMSAPWPTFRHILTTRIHHNLHQYLLLTPPLPYHLLTASTPTVTAPSSPTIPDPRSSLSEGVSVDSFADDPDDAISPGADEVASRERERKEKEEKDRLQRRKAMEEMGKVMDLTPSTPGGLVLPPFLPIGSTASTSSSGSTSLLASGSQSNQLGHRNQMPLSPLNTSSSSTAPLSPILHNPNSSPLTSTLSSSTTAQNHLLSTKHTHDGIPIDPSAVIGGRTLEGWPSREEVWEEERGVRRMLDGFEDEPPFTIQRLAELALSPLKSYSSPGKYLRSLSRTLLVTSSYDPSPSWTDLPSSNGQPSNGSRPNGTRGVDNTPLFSPIPFLIKNGVYNPDGGETNLNGVARSPSPMLLDNVREAAEVASSLLVVEGEDVEMGGVEVAEGGSTNTARPVTNPFLDSKADDTIGEEAKSDAGPEVIQQIKPVNPSDEPFIGRVDELDSGPLPPTLGSVSQLVNSTTTDPDDPHHLQRRPDDTVGAYQEGTGESGNMVPHGMTSTPQPITNTTDLSRTPSNLSSTSSTSNTSAASASAFLSANNNPSTETPPTPTPTSPGGSRKIARLPRSSSSSSLGSLRDRFEAKGVLDVESGTEAGGAGESGMDIDRDVQGATSDGGVVEKESKSDPMEKGDEGVDGTAAKNRRVE